MKKVILHIGTGKTGTTSLQWSFKQNRDYLSSQGVLYPSAGLSTDPHEFAHHPLADAAKKKDALPWQALIAEVECSDCHTIIISSEVMTSLDHKSIEFIRDCLKGLDVSIVVYLREQVDFIEAMYNQIVKTAKETRSRDRYLADFIASGMADYLRLLTRWSTALKPSNTFLRIYHKTRMRNGDIIDDFCGLFSICTDEMLRPARKLNEGVNNKYLELLRQINLLDINVSQKNKKIVSCLLTIDSRTKTHNPPLFGPDQRALVRKFFEEDNRVLANRYMPTHPDKEQMFDIEETTLGDVAPSKVDAEMLVPLLTHLLLR